MQNITIMGETPAQYLQSVVRLDDGKELDFNNYKAYAPLINMPVVQEVNFLTGRQVGKSTFNYTLIYKFAHVPNFRMSYIAPSEMQMTDFSRMKLGLSMKNSPKLKQLLLSTKSPFIPSGMKIESGMLIDDVRLKIFATGASVKLGYASDGVGVNRIRGGSSDLLMMDEAQSIDIDNVLPVLEPILDSSDYGMKVFTGTPLDENDPLTSRFDTTSQHTMMVKCPHCNKYTTLMHLKQITHKGIVCVFCERVVDVNTGQFIPLNPGAARLGFHINKLMFPAVINHPIKYPQLVAKVHDPRANISKICMEDLGVPVSISTRLLSKGDILKCATGQNYDPNDFEAAIRKFKPSYGYTLVYAVDWGGGANDSGGAAQTAGSSQTAETLWVINHDFNIVKMELIYHKLYPLQNVKGCVDTIHQHIRSLPGKTLITTDYLGGAYGNSTIFRHIAENQHLQSLFLTCQLTEVSDTLAFSPLGDRVSVDRNRLLPKFFNKVIQRDLILPSATPLIEEIASNFLAEVEFENEMGKRIWRKRKGTVDDILFSALFAWIIYCIKADCTAELLV